MEKMLEVFDRYSDYKDKAEKTRKKNRDRHSPRKVTTIEN